MPGARIHGGEFAVGKLFSDDFHFSIPLYQRPYSWTTDEASELFEDLLLSLDGPGSATIPDPYFLGSLVLIKPEGIAESQVIDGQQRLTTLTILLAALASAIHDRQIQTALRDRIFQRGDALTGVPPRPRLRLRERDQDWFTTYVQGGNSLVDLLALDRSSLTVPRRSIQENAQLFLTRLEKIGQTRATELARYLIADTYVVVVSTPTLDSAYRIFSVLNDRGLELTAPDILKAEVIGTIPPQGQEVYAAKWEGVEEPLEADQFSELFAHIRTIHGKTKLRGTVLKEFREQVLPKYPDRRVFIDEELGPYADAFGTIRHADFVSTQEAEGVNDLLRWLNRIDNFDWVPPAMAFMRLHSNDGAEVKPFLRDLERLAASMLIRRVIVNERIDRYAAVLAEIEKGSNLRQPSASLQLMTEEKRLTLESLDRDIYNSVRVRLYVLLRLDSYLSGGGASYEYPIITIEHVLPQKMDPASEWISLFDQEKHDEWVHRLANLLLLTRRKNSQAQNYDFPIKKAKYFSEAGGVSPFVLTTQVLQSEAWTPASLADRQSKLLGSLASLWGLRP